MKRCIFCFAVFLIIVFCKNENEYENFDSNYLTCCKLVKFEQKMLENCECVLENKIYYSIVINIVKNICTIDFFKVTCRIIKNHMTYANFIARYKFRPQSARLYIISDSDESNAIMVL